MARHLRRHARNPSCPGVMAEEEPPPVEGLLFNSDLTNAVWFKDSTTISANAVNGPEGTLIADGIVEGVALATAYAVNQVITLTDLTDAAATTASASVLQAGRTWVRLSLVGTACFAWFNVGAGVVGTALNCTSSITAQSGGWYKCAISWTLSKAAAPEFYLMLTDGDWGGTINGSGVVGVYMCNASVTQ